MSSLSQARLRFSFRCLRPLAFAPFLTLGLGLNLSAGSTLSTQGVLDALRGAQVQIEEPGIEELSVEERAAATAESLAVVEERLASARAGNQDALVAQLEREQELLSRTAETQDQIEGAQVDLARSREELESLRGEVDAYLAGTGEDLGQATFATLEEARDELDDDLERAGRIDKQRKAALRQQVLADGALTTSQRRERRARESILRAKDAAQEATARQELRMSELGVAADKEVLALRKLETELVQTRTDSQALDVTRAQAKVERLATVVVLTDEDFDAKNHQIDLWVDDLKARLEVLSGKVDRAEERLSGAEQAAGKTDSSVSESEASTYQQQLRQLRMQQGALRGAIDRASNVRVAWGWRQRLSRNEVEAGECSTWDVRAKAWLDDLDVDQEMIAPDLDDLRTLLQEAQRDRSELPVGAATSLDPSAGLQEALDTLGEISTEIEGDRRMFNRLRQEIAAESRRIPWLHRLHAVWSGVVVLWESELLPLGDQSITVRKLVLGLSLFLCGIWAARRFSRLLGRWLARRFQVDQGELAVAQTLTFYVLVLLFFLVALRIVNVPLTAFTIFGGAIAIGVGFGSQNLLNNFISGLILLMEQPIRVGDLIQVGDLLGNVERIGARSTVVRTGSNIEIVVPNSTFLEQQVVNLTLSESKVRIHVRLGVAYGSPTREVARLLRRAVEEHGRVLKSPDPIVLFEDFGDDALIFEVHFWIQMRKVMDRRTIESDVRFIIDGVFRDAGITIAYPQRDVHLDTTRALDVRVVAPGTEPEPNKSERATRI